MSTTKLVVEIEAKGNYTQDEIRTLAEQLCNYIAGPEGKGLPIGKTYGGTPKKFEVTKADVKRPEEPIWSTNIAR